MLVNGDLDATAFYVDRANLFDRSSIDLARHPRARRLFPDMEAEGVRYFQATGISPINHTVVVRRSLLERHPWIAINLYQAFLEAKEDLRARARELAAPYLRLGLLPREAKAAFAGDPYPYGVQANRQVLEAVAEYSNEQGLTPRRVALDEVFAASTLGV
jgi:4,5-dihydroxyphthalate decarboxylase